MSLLENQSYRKKLSFVNSKDRNKTVSFQINVQCNHDIDKSILTEIEDVINTMLIKDYENLDDIMRKIKLEKEAEKQEKEFEKLEQKMKIEMEKNRQKLLKDQQKPKNEESPKKKKKPVWLK